MGLGTAVAIAGLVGSGYQALKGAQAESAANQAAANAANEAARISEADQFKNLKVPTLGLELAQQNLQADQANQLRALQEMGAAGALGGLTALNREGRAQDLQLAAQANQMQSQRDQMLAQNAQQIEQGRMQREFAMNQAKLSGAQAAASEGRQNIDAGIQGGLGSLANLAMLNTYKDIYGKETPKTDNATKTGSNFFKTLGGKLGLGAQTKVTPKDMSKMTYANFGATGTPVENYLPTSGMAGLTNQFADLQSESDMLRQLQLQKASLQGNPYPINY